jgi:hypothetical protein
VLTVARRLTLRAERLTTLSAGELAAVAGAGGLTGYYPTVDEQCGTYQHCFVLTDLVPPH